VIFIASKKFEINSECELYNPQLLQDLALAATLVKK